MKSNFLKLVLPAFAILLAVGLAFATKEKTVENEGHYLHPINGWTAVSVEPECFTGSDIPCTYNGHQLYAQPSQSSKKLKKD
ncbi:hypothetical protein SAMN04487891_10491 [Flagellimonas taeanensis]|uniref:Uncharacterized protein n=1 Tax=Flagellimonas taeanensis TaxID=1005926 RepID=A0A1M6XBH1_9FLAO|nr:DUF6520 family protein [Allomuricauda taeanensis]SFB96242.1 hypothetical protein SAMN04487891_10491 [Allomuricauda taeanensis]SHL03229.1 hypothetical protein SAMN05216293_2511 [Allomuricauda taeanensis]